MMCETEIRGGSCNPSICGDRGYSGLSCLRLCHDLAFEVLRHRTGSAEDGEGVRPGADTGDD